MKAAEGLPRLRAVFERWLAWTEKAGLGGGCPIAGGFFELATMLTTTPSGNA